MADESTVLVVGAGLSGLVAAAHLQADAVPVAVLEARERVGGRAWSPSLGPESLRLDLGAAWYWEEHSRVRELADRLEIPHIPQHEPGVAIYEQSRSEPPQPFSWPETPPPSWRLDGGMQHLCERLADTLADGTVALNHRVTSLHRTETGVQVTSETPDGPCTTRAHTVIVAVPPRLVSHTVQFDPTLSRALHRAQHRTPTWMASAGKAAATFPVAFWREQGIDGRVVSHAGPVAHWHDAVAPDGRAALAGFLHSSGLQILASSGPEALYDAIREQLAHCFGAEASPPTDLAVNDWRTDRGTTPPDVTPMSPSHPPAPPAVLTEPCWNGRLLWAGAETAQDHPGFLDGAIEAGERAATQVLNRADP